MAAYTLRCKFCNARITVHSHFGAMHINKKHLTCGECHKRRVVVDREPDFIEDDDIDLDEDDFT